MRLVLLDLQNHECGGQHGGWEDGVAIQVSMVDWSRIERTTGCSNLKRWEGPRVYIRTLGQSTAYMAAYSDFRLVPKGMADMAALLAL